MLSKPTDLTQTVLEINLKEQNFPKILLVSFYITNEFAVVHTKELGGLRGILLVACIVCVGDKVPLPLVLRRPLRPPLGLSFAPGEH